MFESVSAPTRPNWKLQIVLIALGTGLLLGLVSIWRMTVMPLHSYGEPLPALTSEQEQLRDSLATSVKYLSDTIGERNLARVGSLETTSQYIRSELEQMGYPVHKQSYSVGTHQVLNLEVTLAGNQAGKDTVVVGGHYDSAIGAPGANDNGTGVAALLELARMFKGKTFRKTIRLVFFVNEEPPYFQTNQMGSLVYAEQLQRNHTSVSAMISLETIGFYSDTLGSQKYPTLLNLLYPSRGNFIGFVGNTQSRDLVRQSVRLFRECASFPSEGIAAPDNWPGIGWSDQWSFWQEQYPALMVTDTAPFRYPYYHTANDSAKFVDFDRMARVVDGIGRVVESLASDSSECAH